MTICAVVQLSDGVVVNRIIAEPGDLAPDGTYLVLIPDGTICNSGWVWDGINFINPNPTVIDSDLTT